MTIIFKLISELGEFTSDKLEVTDEEYINLIDKSKGFYAGGYDMYLPDGFLVVSPEVIKKSILKIEIIKN